jgi:hypothetical protein
MTRWAGPVLCIASVIVVGHGLATASPWLLWPVPPWSIPLGNLATWWGIIALALLAAVSVRRHPRLRWPARFGVFAAVAWYPVSVALSGNVGNVFHGDERSMLLWRFFTTFAAGWPLLLLLAAGVLAIVPDGGRPRS